jgi:CDP-diacylglycerol--serine O-phosphatidyltransferase
MNLFSGFLSIVHASDGRLTQAAWLIILAAFFDVLDGLMARLTQGDSAFGIELDSLSDLVSFGVAPSFLIYQYGLNQYNMLGILVAALPAICGAVRLARFNVNTEGEKKSYFEGMPIPTLAGTIVAFILTFDDPSWFERFSMGMLSILIPFVVTLSVLMLTNIQFDSLPRFSPTELRRHRWTVIAFCTGFLLTVFLQETGLFISAISYITFSIGRAVFRFGHAIWYADDEST